MPLSEKEGRMALRYHTPYPWTIERKRNEEHDICLERPGAWRSASVELLRWNQDHVKDIAKFWVPMLFRSSEYLHGWYQVEPLAHFQNFPTSPSSEVAEDPVHALAAALPEELFQHICDATDSWGARTCRLVCRYWEMRSRYCAMRRVNFRQSPQRVLDFWALHKDPTCRFMRYLKHAARLPKYDSSCTSPWIHILAQSWENELLDEDIVVEGPFPGRLQTVRTIHLSVPRTLPRLFSRNIGAIALKNIHFRRFEDTAHLVCELPDLQSLTLSEVTWGSLPIALPRRPRTDRNKLRIILHEWCKASPSKASGATEELPNAAADPPDAAPEPAHEPLDAAVFTLYASVYDIAAESFFSEDDVASIYALLQTMRVSPKDTDARTGRDVEWDTHFMYHPEKHSIIFTVGTPHTKYIRLYAEQDPKDKAHIFVSLQPSTRVDTKPVDVIDWTRFDALLSNMGPQSRVLFGFTDREHMLHFAETVVKQDMPLLSEREAVCYAIGKKEKRDKELPGDGWYWYEAQLGMEELKGEGARCLWEIYS